MDDLPLDAARTAQALPWVPLVDEIEALLADPGVAVPPRIVMPTAHGACLFVMPACDARTAMTKLITFTPGNAGGARPTIQGDVTVFDVATGERRLVLDGPTVTGRRTAAVSALAARRLAPNPDGPMLVVGAGVQGRAHVEAFAAVLGVRRFLIASRGAASAEALAEHAPRPWPSMRDRWARRPRWCRMPTPRWPTARWPPPARPPAAWCCGRRRGPTASSPPSVPSRRGWWSWTPPCAAASPRRAASWSMRARPTTRRVTCSRPGWTWPPCPRWPT
ncbi:hypothetical protein [Ottowia sp.]|uniref:hypothetical protein n=1 Tax=Ottowia sp. TaxID=1898956 RepID=UPI0039E6E8D3